MTWIKSWDEYVFGVERYDGNIRVSKHKSNMKRKATQMNEYKKSNKCLLTPTNQNQAGYQNYNKSEEKIDFGLDEKGKPIQKIALIWGPPGLGKTTLAQIITKHSGYDAIEVNASDERNEHSFRDVIQNVLQTHSIKNIYQDKGNDSLTHKKPKCLILDEIDGASSSAIDTLIDLVKSSQDSTRSDKKGRKNLSLNRPVICLANDIYTPALKALRQHSYIINVKSISSFRLTNRLKKICQEEKIGLEGDKILHTLALLLENDIRSCINCLQFITAHKKSQGGSAITITLDDVMNRISPAMDDFGLEQISLNNCWSFLKDKTFNNDYLLKTVFFYDEKDGHNNKLSEDLTKILKLSYNTLSMDKMSVNLFENYLRLPSLTSDIFMKKITNALDWLTSFHEILQKFVNSYQTYSLYGYLNYLNVIFAINFRSHNIAYSGAQSFTQISAFPQKNFQASQRTYKMVNLIKSFLKHCSTKVKFHLDFDNACLDITPALLDIITPNLRQVNFQLYNLNEKKIMNELCQIMVQYDLNYRQDRIFNRMGHKAGLQDDDENQMVAYSYDYVLDPNIKEIAYFEGYTSVTGANNNGIVSQVSHCVKTNLSYGTKQIVQQQINITKLKMLENKYSSNNLNQTDTKFNEEKRPNSEIMKSFCKNSHTPNIEDIKASTDIITRIRNKKDKQTKKRLNTFDNFFTKIGKKAKENCQSKNVDTLLNKKEVKKQEFNFPRGVNYLYKDGHTNAVRRFLKIKDFLKN
ncbi:chromosome transmission fidelity protein 18 homolog [Gordionus sp. m RMFG-2023]|uniref:chromosome transmission fidelity protein 18 homolog n=1 Tax=Gordionus sp. m RMFG-2023 TaxID=3053472 RepID=UPI0031FDC6AA